MIVSADLNSTNRSADGSLNVGCDITAPNSAGVVKIGDDDDARKAAEDLEECRNGKLVVANTDKMVVDDGDESVFPASVSSTLSLSVTPCLSLAVTNTSCDTPPGTISVSPSVNAERLTALDCEAKDVVSLISSEKLLPKHHPPPSSVEQPLLLDSNTYDVISLTSADAVSLKGHSAIDGDLSDGQINLSVLPSANIISPHGQYSSPVSSIVGDGTNANFVEEVWHDELAIRSSSNTQATCSVGVDVRKEEDAITDNQSFNAVHNLSFYTSMVSAAVGVSGLECVQKPAYSSGDNKGDGVDVGDDLSGDAVSTTVSSASSVWSDTKVEKILSKSEPVKGRHNRGIVSKVRSPGGVELRPSCRRISEGFQISADVEAVDSVPDGMIVDADNGRKAFPSSEPPCSRQDGVDLGDVWQSDGALLRGALERVRVELQRQSSELSCLRQELRSENDQLESLVNSLAPKIDEVASSLVDLATHSAPRNRILVGLRGRTQEEVQRVDPGKFFQGAELGELADQWGWRRETRLTFPAPAV